MRAIIDSIHSQVPRSIDKLSHRVDLVVSLDSHLDVALGGDYRVYPKELRAIARRTGAHTAIRKLVDRSGGDLIVAIPERMFAKHAQEVEMSLPSELRVSTGEKSISYVAKFLRKERGIRVFQSPPASLLELVPRTRTSASWVLDVDVDYMAEMQDECYTRIINPGAGVLQSASRVLEFIDSARPRGITVSEAKLSAIRDENSSFSGFIREIGRLGYEVQEGEVFPSDRQVVKGIAECKRFYNSVSKKLLEDHMSEMMRGDYTGFRREERAAAKGFFARRGYDMGPARKGPPGDRWAGSDSNTRPWRPSAFAV